VPLRRRKRYFFLIYLAIREEFSQLWLIVDLSMVGKPETSTIDQTRGVPPLLCSKWKMVTVLVATPINSGNLQVLTSLILIEMPFCSIYRENVNTKTKKQAKKYGAEVKMALFSVELS
jgi:hypothetical protein